MKDPRLKWATIKNKRYIRGMINGRIQDTLHNRQKGEVTTNPDIRRQVLAKTGGYCYLCRRKYTQDQRLAHFLPRLYFSILEIDHVIPLSKFGANAVSNYMPACKRCNQLKSDHRLPEAKLIIQRAIAKTGY